MVPELASARPMQRCDEMGLQDALPDKPPGLCASVTSHDTDPSSCHGFDLMGNGWFSDFSRLEDELLLTATSKVPAFEQSSNQRRATSMGGSAAGSAKKASVCRNASVPQKTLRMPLLPCSGAASPLFVESSHNPSSSAPIGENSPRNQMTSGGANFCCECGTKLPFVTAKFCPECGTSTRKPNETATDTSATKNDTIALPSPLKPPPCAGLLAASTTQAAIPVATALRGPSRAVTAATNSLGQGQAVKWKTDHLWSDQAHHGGVGMQRNSAGARAARAREEEKAGMVDKRKARQMNRASFERGIAEHREQNAELPQSPAKRLRAASEHSAGSEIAAGGSSAVLAFVRKRPLLSHEIERREFDALSIDEARSSAEAHCCLMRPDLVRMFIRHSSFVASGATFDGVCDEQHVYSSSTAPLVAHALGGGRATLFLYGQTGSGKTHTMHELLGRLGLHLLGDEGASLIALTAIEVMGKRCFDLATGQECKLHQQPGGAIQLFGAGHQELHAADELEVALAKALARRTTEATSANSRSSRSHALIVLDVLSHAPERGVRRGGRLTLVDCAGSEWSADSAAHCSNRRREGAKINSSLHALKQCVRAYGERFGTEN